MSKSFYLTTTLPYVNADPHIGTALEFVHADIIARYKKLCGYEVFFNTGTDEHGQKIYAKAVELGKTPQAYVDECAKRWKETLLTLNIENNNFIRTTDRSHVEAAQEFWKRCDKNGFIEKRKQLIKYCVGCELEKTDSELTQDKKCLIHPNLEIEIREEENYFFKFSQFQDKLLKLYNKNPTFVVPESRFNEIKEFVARGLQDFSISRLTEKMSWGIPVPGDDQHVMYVWFDALVNYISAIGWPEDEEKFKKWWPVTQLAGKDNLRQQSAMWQAMLMAVGIEPSQQIVIHGFITSGGQKMSKSLGNVIDPVELAQKYGTDALRYFLAREVNTFEDTDVTEGRFKEAYNANLANGLGNLVSRIMKMFTQYNSYKLVDRHIFEIDFSVQEHINNYEIQKAIDDIWRRIRELDLDIQKNEPFKVYKTNPDKATEDVAMFAEKLNQIAILLKPFMPATAEKIQTAIKENKMPEPLFRRIE